jgi:hypothetical protein
MKGVVLAEVREAIIGAFTGPTFDMFLSDKLGFDRPAHVGDGPFAQVVHEVLKHFVGEGRDAYLIAEVAAFRPLKADIQRVYRQYARGLIGDAWIDRVEASQIATLEKYGLVPPVELQQAGKTTLATPLPFTDQGFQRQINAALPQLDAYVWATQLLKHMRRVCRIEIDDVARGTGFLVGPDVVLTNHHVLQTLIAGRGGGGSVKCRFDYMVRNDGQESDGTILGLKTAWPDWHLDSSPALANTSEHSGTPQPSPDELDHALVRLERRFGDEPIFKDGPRRGWIALPTATPNLHANMPLAILQHPNRQPVKLALDTNAVLSVNDGGTRVRYATNTDPGSSGSPCFSVSWKLVALHHFGDPEGRPPAYNQGIPISAIRDRLTREGHGAALGGDPP